MRCPELKKKARKKYLHFSVINISTLSLRTTVFINGWSADRCRVAGGLFYVDPQILVSVVLYFTPAEKYYFTISDLFLLSFSF